MHPPSRMYWARKGIRGYHSCSRCQIRGEPAGRHACFPGAISQARTNEEFRNYSYLGTYQLARTSWVSVPNFNLVDDVVLDYMHLVCLGIMKKLLKFWMTGPLNIRLSIAKQAQFETNYSRACEYLPQECHQTDAIKYLKTWKAKNYRQFLLYVGPVTLKGVLREDLYKNFLYFHLAISILVNPHLCSEPRFLNCAESLLSKFNKGFTTLYGKARVSYNVHGLLHLTDDVRRFGPLDTISAFKFETHIAKVKRVLRRGNHPLAQISRRFVEMENAPEKPQNQARIDSRDESAGTVTHKKFSTHDYVLNCDVRKDSFVILKNGSVLQCKYFRQLSDDGIFVSGIVHEFVENLYESPWQSNRTNAGVITPPAFENMVTHSTKDIRAKLCVLPYKDLLAYTPIIHTLSY